MLRRERDSGRRVHGAALGARRAAVAGAARQPLQQRPPRPAVREAEAEAAAGTRRGAVRHRRPCCPRPARGDQAGQQHKKQQRASARRRRAPRPRAAGTHMLMDSAHTHQLIWQRTFGRDVTR